MGVAPRHDGGISDQLLFSGNIRYNGGGDGTDVERSLVPMSLMLSVNVQ